ncbi:hypothetical protein [Oceanimonas smirnovii]|nr:hypothetical protein [Oceanimonas smirnovii]
MSAIIPAHPCFFLLHLAGLLPLAEGLTLVLALALVFKMPVAKRAVVE